MIYALVWDITQRMMVRNYHYSLHNDSEEPDIIYFAEEA